MVNGAKISVDKLKQIRVVAFASCGFVSDFEKTTDNPITTVHKKIVTARIGSADELNYLVKIS